MPLTITQKFKNTKQWMRNHWKWNLLTNRWFWMLLCAHQSLLNCKNSSPLCTTKAGRILSAFFKSRFATEPTELIVWLATQVIPMRIERTPQTMDSRNCFCSFYAYKHACEMATRTGWFAQWVCGWPLGRPDCDKVSLATQSTLHQSLQ